MDAVPMHILVDILEAMDTRSVVRASMTCRALRDAAERVRSLRPVLRPRTVTEQLVWMAARRDRVTRVRAVQLSPLSPCWAALANLPALDTLTVALSRVPDSILHTLPAAAPRLRALDIHHLVRGPRRNDVFSTSVLARFPALRRAHITFAPGWALALVGPGDLPHLEFIELRLIPAIAVIASLPVTGHVGLHALDVLHGTVPVAPRCDSLSIRCDATPIDTLANLIHADVRVLSISTPQQHMPQDVDVTTFTKLRSLTLNAKLIVVPDMRGLTRLTRLRLDASAGYVVCDHRRSAVPLGLRVIQAYSRHRPIDITPYLAATHSDASTLSIL